MYLHLHGAIADSENVLLVYFSKYLSFTGHEPFSSSLKSNLLHLLPFRFPSLICGRLFHHFPSSARVHYLDGSTQENGVQGAQMSVVDGLAVAASRAEAGAHHLSSEKTSGGIPQLE